MALSHRRTIAMMFYRNARELSEVQLWNSLGRIAKVQRDTDYVDTVQLQRDLRPLLRWSASCSLSDNLTRVTGGLVGYLEESDLTSAMVNEDGSWLKGPGKIVTQRGKELIPPCLGLCTVPTISVRLCSFLVSFLLCGYIPWHGHVLPGTKVIKIMCVNQLYQQG